jgi:quercetin dioxygenase-like cupin family protein
VKRSKLGSVAAVSFFSSLCLSMAADSDAFIRVAPEQVEFKGTPTFSQAVLYGDPSKAGIYVVRVKFGKGVHTNPHTHSQDRFVTVIKGLWCMGVGDKVDEKSVMPLKVGSFAVHPARASHYDGACDEETIVQITGMGPVDTVPVDSKSERTGTWTAAKSSN